jgi:hypothetical protein
MTEISVLVIEEFGNWKSFGIWLLEFQNQFQYGVSFA